MNRVADAAVAEAELILFVCEANRWTSEDGRALERVAAAARCPVIAVLNKIDKVHPREELLRSIEEVAARHAFAEVVPVSARRGDNLDRLAQVVRGYLPESPALYPTDAVSDRSETFCAA